MDTPAFTRAKRRYASAWLVLLLLLGVSAAAAQLHLGAVNLMVSLGIALAKVAVIGWVFMGLGRDGRLPRVVTAVGIVAWSLLAGLSAVDLLTRHDNPAAWQSPQAVAPALTQMHCDAAPSYTPQRREGQTSAGR